MKVHQRDQDHLETHGFCYRRWMISKERKAIMSRFTDEMVKYFCRSSSSSGSGLLTAMRFFRLHNNRVGLPGNKHVLTSVSSSSSLMPSDVRKQLVNVAQTSQNTPMLPQWWFCSGSVCESTISPHKHNWNSSPRPASSHAEENKFHTRFCPTASPCHKLAGISPFK